jgi:hypothetical protein
MIVMVESENITGSIHSQQAQQQQQQAQNYNYPDRSTAAGPGLQSPVYASTSGKLYNQYFRREGRNDSMLDAQFPRPPTSQMLASPRQAAEAGGLSKQGSTRGRELPYSPTLGQVYPSQSSHVSQQTAGGARRGEVVMDRERGMPMSAAGLHSSQEVRAGPYVGHQSSATRKGAAQISGNMSGMSTGSLTGAAATSYPSAGSLTGTAATSYPTSADVKPSYPMGTASHIQAQGPQKTSSRLAAGGDKELSRERDVYERNRREMRERQERGGGAVSEEAFADF